LDIYARNATAFLEAKKEALAIMKRMYVFVLIPFAREFSDIYKFGIKQTVDDMGMKCERVDERHFTRSVLQEIYRCIERSNIVVADITGRNPNVFYEIGYAHALKKDVILLVQDEEDVPFDLHDMNHINYKGSILKKEFQY
jgi:nucleoside 2-deoxyribosyltransferase